MARLAEYQQFLLARDAQGITGETERWERLPCSQFEEIRKHYFLHDDEPTGTFGITQHDCKKEFGECGRRVLLEGQGIPPHEIQEMLKGERVKSLNAAKQRLIDEKMGNITHRVLGTGSQPLHPWIPAWWVPTDGLPVPPSEAAETNCAESFNSLIGVTAGPNNAASTAPRTTPMPGNGSPATVDHDDDQASAGPSSKPQIPSSPTCVTVNTNTQGAAQTNPTRQAQKRNYEWSDEETTLLVRRRNEGWAFERIAAELDFHSASSCRAKHSKITRNAAN
ncbi:hypothetical protein OQA88_9726 [Cercophora sp. LCS_1]